MFGLKCIVTLFALVLAANGDAREKRLVGGIVFEKGRNPYHVSLWYMGENNFTEKTPDLHHTCGGSLIKDRWVLTTAYCFDDEWFMPGVGNVSNWKVVLGMYGQKDAETEAQFRGIEAVFASDKYNYSEGTGDIALLKLSSPADLSAKNVATVNYNKNGDCPSAGQTCWSIGWGQISEEPYGYGAEFPHEANLIIANNEACSRAYSSSSVQDELGPVHVDYTVMCAGWPEGNADSCIGDSGSPLLCYCDDCEEKEDSDGADDYNVVLAGIVAYGFGCGRPGYPGVYTRANIYADWIAATIAANT